MTNKDFPVFGILKATGEAIDVIHKATDPSRKEARVRAKHLKLVLEELRKDKIHVGAFLNDCLNNGVEEEEVNRMHALIKGYARRKAQIK